MYLLKSNLFSVCYLTLLTRNGVEGVVRKRNFTGKIIEPLHMSYYMKQKNY